MAASLVMKASVTMASWITSYLASIVCRIGSSVIGRVDMTRENWPVLLHVRKCHRRALMRTWSLRLTLKRIRTNDMGERMIRWWLLHLQASCSFPPRLRHNYRKITWRMLRLVLLFQANCSLFLGLGNDYWDVT